MFTPRIVLLFIIIMAFTGCGPGNESTAFSVGTWKTQQTIQPFIYNQYLPAPRSCDVKPFTNPGDMKTALMAGSLDICGTTLVHAIISASRGEPIVLVASLCNRCSALVVGIGSDIRSVGDLRGKRIGYVPSTMHHILLLTALHRAGLSASDVTLIRVDFFDMLNALSQNQIDAFLSGEPFPSQAVHKGYGRVLAYPYFDDTVGPINAGLIVRRDYLDLHPDAVQSLVRAHARATGHLRRRPDEWIELATRFGNDPEILGTAARNIALVWDMDETYVARVKRLGRQMLDRGMIRRLPDWDRLIDTRFVDAIRKAEALP